MWTQQKLIGWWPGTFANGYYTMYTIMHHDPHDKILKFWNFEIPNIFKNFWKYSEFQWNFYLNDFDPTMCGLDNQVPR